MDSDNKTLDTSKTLRDLVDDYDRDNIIYREIKISTFTNSLYKNNFKINVSNNSKNSINNYEHKIVDIISNKDLKSRNAYEEIIDALTKKGGTTNNIFIIYSLLEKNKLTYEKYLDIVNVFSMFYGTILIEEKNGNKYNYKFVTVSMDFEIPHPINSNISKEKIINIAAPASFFVITIILVTTIALVIIKKRK